MALLEDVILRGDRASQPAANTVAIGTLYFVTDEGVTERSDGATWESYSAGSSGITELTGDVTAGPGIGSQAATIAANAVTTTKINAQAVTYAKIQNASATAKILARKTSGAGSYEESTISEILDFLASVARGNIIYRNATEWVVLAPGTAGQLLQTGGAGADPSWTTVSSGDTGSFLVVPQTCYAWMVGYNTSGSFDIVPLAGGSSPTVGFNVLTKDTSHSDNLYGTIASQASSGSDFGWRTSNFTLVQRQWFPTYETIILSPDIITSVRFWVGLTSAQMTDSDTAPGHFMGFRFSTVAGDTGWTPITRDGTTQNAATTIGTVAANTAYRLKIRCTSGHVFFSVNGGAETDVTSNLPTSTQDLGINHRGFTQNGTAKKQGICRSRLVFGTQP